MRRVPAKYTGLMLAILALVFVIGLIEVNELELPGLATQPVAIDVDAVMADSAIEEEEQTDCVRAESEFSAMLDQSRSCNVDADCNLASFGCPFDCVAAVAGPALADLQREERSFQQACHRCVSECPVTLVKWRAACIRQRCIVLDRTIEELEEETLRLMDESS